MLRLHPAGYAQHERTSKPARPERSAAKSKGEQGVFTTHLKKDPSISVVTIFLLLEERGSKEARQMLAEIYGWFTEGFDTADLQEAGVLREELS
jgi:hypothetical protein